MKRHLISAADLTYDDALLVLDTATEMAALSHREIKKLPTLRGRTVVNLFFEDSTRTRISFEAAAKRLSADVINFAAKGSSVSKGETLKDTALTLEAMGADAVVIRHGSSGAPHRLANSGWIGGSVVNAGDGTHEHPTQALLDALTIRDRRGTIENLNITILGDILHSRVARSDIHLLAKFGCRFTLCGPTMWVPRELECLGPAGTSIRRVTRIAEALEDADVIVTLRVQQERLHEPALALDEYILQYQLTPERLRLARPDALVLHPGPVIRGHEIDSAVADGPQSCVLEQVANGVAVRMALLFLMIGSGTDAPAEKDSSHAAD